MTTESATADDEGERFIPIARRELSALLAAHPAIGDRGPDVRRLADMLAHVFHFLFHQEVLALKRDYAPLDPDAPYRSLSSYDDGERAACATAFTERFEDVLRRANYRRVGEAELQELLDMASPWALDLEVDFDQFRHFCFYYRGLGDEQRDYRSAGTLFRMRKHDTVVFRRLVLLAHFQKDAELPNGIDPDFVYLKIFKNIPRGDIEMLFPNTEPRMKLFDKFRVIAPLAGGIGSSLLKIFLAAVINTWAAVMFAIAFIVYGVKGFLGYLNVKRNYQGTLVSSLYFNSLDNNLGVIHNVIDQAEEEECKEALLAYVFLLVDDASRESEAAMDRRIEAWLDERCGVQLNFEAPDALAKLERLGLLTRDGDRLDVVDVRSALAKLDATWDGYFDYAVED